jgi:hypothetical protein
MTKVAAAEMTTAKVAATKVATTTKVAASTESRCCTRHGDANGYRQGRANH